MAIYKVPFNLSTVVKEFGSSSIKDCGDKAGLKTPFKCTEFVGKSLLMYKLVEEFTCPKPSEPTYFSIPIQVFKDDTEVTEHCTFDLYSQVQGIEIEDTRPAKINDNLYGIDLSVTESAPLGTQTLRMSITYSDGDETETITDVLLKVSLIGSDQQYTIDGGLFRIPPTGVNKQGNNVLDPKGDPVDGELTIPLQSFKSMFAHDSITPEQEIWVDKDEYAATFSFDSKSSLSVLTFPNVPAWGDNPSSPAVYQTPVIGILEYEDVATKKLVSKAIVVFVSIALTGTWVAPRPKLTIAYKDTWMDAKSTERLGTIAYSRYEIITFPDVCFSTDDYYQVGWILTYKQGVTPNDKHLQYAINHRELAGEVIDSTGIEKSSGTIDLIAEPLMIKKNTGIMVPSLPNKREVYGFKIFTKTEKSEFAYKNLTNNLENVPPKIGSNFDAEPCLGYVSEFIHESGKSQGRVHYAGHKNIYGTLIVVGHFEDDDDFVPCVIVDKCDGIKINSCEIKITNKAGKQLTLTLNVRRSIADNLIMFYCIPVRSNETEMVALLTYVWQLDKSDSKVEQTLEFFTGSINSLDDGRPVDPTPTDPDN